MLSVVEAEEVASAMSYAEQEKSEGTRRAYRSDFSIFVAWCEARGLASLPATPATTARFLSWQADSAKKSSTMGSPHDLYKTAR
jgi:site-specific recombinase XerD